MSKPASTPGTKVQPPPLPTHETGRVSGARRALNYGAYDGLMQLGSDAFTAPLPPPKSERPLFAPRRIHAGWYMISAAAGFSVGAVVLAIVFKPTLTPERPPVSLAQSTGYVGPWTVVTNNKPVQMREVLEPVQPIDAPAHPQPAAQVAAQELQAKVTGQAAEPEPPVQAAAPEPVASPEPAADAAPVAAQPTKSDPVAAARPEPRATRESSSHGHHREREAAPVAQLSRAQVIAAMSKIQPEVGTCFRGTNGGAMADVTILGRTGRVTTAQVSGQTGAVGSCIARAVRKATFPTFKAETLTIRYPFAH